jgi:hypothetical protein
MKWIYKDEKWFAQGEYGDFLVWRIRRGVYKARYRSKDKKRLFFLGIGTVSEVKKRCEKNFFWE